MHTHIIFIKLYSCRYGNNLKGLTGNNCSVLNSKSSTGELVKEKFQTQCKNIVLFISFYNELITVNSPELKNKTKLEDTKHLYKKVEAYI